MRFYRSLMGAVFLFISENIYKKVLTISIFCGIIYTVKEHKIKHQTEEMKMKDIESSAATLYDGGWRTDEREALIGEYDLTEEEADVICEKLAEYAARENN